MIKKYISDIKNEFKGYNSKSFSKDLMAGLTVTAVALPLALAFGVSSGANAAAGLITAIIAGLIIAGLSGASFQISGPSGSMSAILIVIVLKYQMQGIFIACFIAGAALIIAGIFKVGKLVAFIPSPVITGFTSGIAVIIALGQVDNFFGVKSHGENAVQKLLSYGEMGFKPNFYAIAIAIAVILIMAFYPKKLNAKFSSSLVVIIIMVAANMIFQFPVATVGEIPKTLLPENRLILSDVTMAQINDLIVPGISIALLCMIESLLCGASAVKMKKGSLFDADRELLSLGVGNMILPFFGGVPATAAIARTSVGIKSGSVTRLTSIIQSAGLVASMFLLGGVMSKIPLSALAGVLMVTAFRTNDWNSIRYMFKNKFKSSMAQFIITMLSTIVFDLTIAIVVGVAVSVVLFVVRLSDIQIDVADVDEEKLNRELGHFDFSQAKVVYVTGPIFFGNIDKFTQAISELNDSDLIVLSLRGVSMIDLNTVSVIAEVISALHDANVKLVACGVSKNAMLTLKRAGVADIIGEDNFYWDTKSALEAQV